MAAGLMMLIPFALAATGSVRVAGVDAAGDPVEGGQVMLDGFPTGEEIPALLENVPQGKHNVSLKVGCGEGESAVTVQPGKTVKVRVALKNRDGEGTVRVSGIPEGARVRFDGEEVDLSSGSLESACGTHKLSVKAAGFAPWEESFVVTVDEWVTVKVELERGEMGDGAGAVATSSSRKSGVFADDLDEDFEFEDGADYSGAFGGDDDFVGDGDDDGGGGGGIVGGRAPTSSDAFVDEGQSDDSYIPPSVAAALAEKKNEGDDDGVAAVVILDDEPAAARGSKQRAPREKAERPPREKAERPPREKAERPPREKAERPEREKPERASRDERTEDRRDDRLSKAARGGDGGRDRSERSERTPRGSRDDRGVTKRDDSSLQGGPSWVQWTALGGSSAVAIGGLSYALYQNSQVAAAERAWQAAIGGEQPGTIIVAAFDRMEAAKRGRTIGYAAMGLGLAGVAGTSTWIVLSGDRDGAAVVFGGEF